MAEILGRNKINAGGSEYRNFLIPLLGVIFGSSAIKNASDQKASAEQFSAQQEVAAADEAAYQAADKAKQQAAANIIVVNMIAPYVIGGIILIEVGIVIYRRLKR